MKAQQGIMNTGLRDVVIASTRISDVNGKACRLVYRGYLIQELAEKATFEEVSFLLLHEKLPNPAELEDFDKQLKVERVLPGAVLNGLKTCPKTALPMDVLQAAVPLLAHHDPDVTHDSRAAAERMAVRLISRLAAVLAAWQRIRNGLEPLAPLPKLGHAANFLYMMTGEEPDDQTARFLDTALVLHAEHSFNASTFAAREVASTRAHMYAAVAAAVGSLSGSLHGGANTRVMQMLLDIGEVDRADAFVRQELDAGRKIMGLGHAVYTCDDPRALILASMSKTMGEKTGQSRWYEISRILEVKGKEIFKQRKGIDIFVNVDFYSASLYHAMGIPLDLFTPIFAISRVAGWTAHVIEEQFAGAAPKPVLYRPESEYIGEYCGPTECVFVPLDQR
jgi:citrate synthase